jgi:hypothetical protein
MHSNSIIPSTIRSSEWSLYFALSRRTVYNFISSLMCATCPAYLILFGMICLMIFGDKYKF